MVERREKQQKRKKRRKVLPERLKIGGREEGKATKKKEKAKSVARGVENRRLSGGQAS